MHSENTKSKIVNHLEALHRFNQWEKNRFDRMEDGQNLSAVFKLYELIPEEARQRPVNVEGIMKMRKALACLR